MAETQPFWPAQTTGYQPFWAGPRTGTVDPAASRVRISRRRGRLGAAIEGCATGIDDLPGHAGRGRGGRHGGRWGGVTVGVGVVCSPDLEVGGRDPAVLARADDGIPAILAGPRTGTVDPAASRVMMVAVVDGWARQLRVAPPVLTTFPVMPIGVAVGVTVGGVLPTLKDTVL